MRISLLFIFVLVLLLTVIIGCYKDEYYTAGDAKLRFSTDTITFDTVFTARGTATKILKIYNDYDKTLIIKDIKIASNKFNQFRLNIDGVSTNEAKNIEIGPKDSIYVFAEAHINPDDPLSISPFIVTDSIIFSLDNSVQRVLMNAWGQNANYIRTEQFGKLSCNMGEIIWNDPKPYIIYGSLRIDSCKLTLPPGTHVYVHGGIAKGDDGNFYYNGNIFIYKNGKLNVQGTAENPVRIQTDRLERQYQDINALWNGIFFLSESKGNKIDHAEIQNATIGIYLDSMAEVNLQSTKIQHIGAYGIYSKHATLSATNCLIADIGSYNVVVDYGGDINMKYCTVYNNNSEDAIAVKNYKCINSLCTEVIPYRLNLNVTNCIFYGTSDDELLLSKANGSDDFSFNYNFENCLVKYKDLTKDIPDFADKCKNCINGIGKSELFIDTEKYNYQPDTMSIVIDKAKTLTGINLDIEGKSREVLPDIGCYEFIH